MWLHFPLNQDWIKQDWIIFYVFSKAYNLIWSKKIQSHKKSLNNRMRRYCVRQEWEKKTLLAAWRVPMCKIISDSKCQMQIIFRILGCMTGSRDMQNQPHKYTMYNINRMTRAWTWPIFRFMRLILNRCRNLVWACCWRWMHHLYTYTLYVDCVFLFFLLVFIAENV